MGFNIGPFRYEPEKEAAKKVGKGLARATGELIPVAAEAGVKFGQRLDELDPALKATAAKFNIPLAAPAAGDSDVFGILASNITKVREETARTIEQLGIEQAELTGASLAAASASGIQTTSGSVQSHIEKLQGSFAKEIGLVKKLSEQNIEATATEGLMEIAAGTFTARQRVLAEETARRSASSAKRAGSTSRFIGGVAAGAAIGGPVGGAIGGFASMLMDE